ncbi:hypothetical protein BAE44_0021410 [Dichanthelium oligosanthes]|uniref:Uncharacterized protein n=1 Tax=Dichanthelium oligosanthes TaxID=888268 RepID=A0A1E5UXI7_9POAL|nr:hypothetical protein BAE44_0021410 [Dichanthelium oligosanthes]
MQDIHGEDQLQDNQGQIYNQNMQLGFVQLFEPVTYPILLNKFPKPVLFKQNLDAIRLWAKFLAPGPGSPEVLVPKSWVDFFTSMLLNSGSFGWAKNFLASPALDFLNSESSSSVPFILPSACPDLPAHSFSEQMLHQNFASTTLQSTPLQDKSKGKGKVQPSD